MIPITAKVATFIVIVLLLITMLPFSKFLPNELSVSELRSVFLELNARFCRDRLGDVIVVERGVLQNL